MNAARIISRLKIRMLTGEPLPGQVVLEDDDSDRRDFWGYKGRSFFIASNGFNKYGVRITNNEGMLLWRWYQEDYGWRVAPDPLVIMHLHSWFGDRLLIHPAAVERVIEVLGWDPTAGMKRPRKQSKPRLLLGIAPIKQSIPAASVRNADSMKAPRSMPLSESVVK